MACDPFHWLVLSAIPGLGPVGIASLIQQFKNPENILKASITDLKQTTGIGPQLAKSIAQQQPIAWAKQQIQLANKCNIQILTLSDEQYPLHLRQIFAPPPILFYRGDITQCHAPTIAIVGSRSFTAYGRNIATQLAHELSNLGVTIVSGMALGIDTHAHTGVLQNNGATAAILGSSLDHPYPSQNLQLYKRICESGVAISEFPMGTKPEAHHFPRRNRIISGLSLGTVVVEAGQRSGALITAQYALEQNREVFAVPGPINSGRSIGTHQLIQQGAQLILKAEDIVTEIQRHVTLPNSVIKPTSQTELQLEGDAQKVWDHLPSTEPIQLNDLARVLNLPTPETQNILLTLELEGLIEQLPGLFYTRRT